MIHYRDISHINMRGLIIILLCKYKIIYYFPSLISMHHSASNKTKYSGGNCTLIIITLYYKSQVLDNKQINVQLDKQHETYIENLDLSHVMQKNTRTEQFLSKCKMVVHVCKFHINIFIL